MKPLFIPSFPLSLEKWVRFSIADSRRATTGSRGTQPLCELFRRWISTQTHAQITFLFSLPFLVDRNETSLVSNDLI